MRLLTGLMGKKSRGAASSEAPRPYPGHALHDQMEPFVPETRLHPDEKPSAFADSKTKAIFEAQRDVYAASSQVNIWDLEGDAVAQEAKVNSPLVEALQAPPAPRAADTELEAARASARNRRNRTRIIGFEKSSGDFVHLYEEQKTATPKNLVEFPVGWLLVVDGPGRGHCFSLFAGMAQIGRGEDQSVQLDFGDNAISRNNHAAVVFDPEEKKFVLGHGGKANIVRLNGKPVVSNEDLVDGDRIRIGETTLLMKALCGPDFQWEAEATHEEEDDDVAIA